MELFARAPVANLLPYDGEVVYYGNLLHSGQAENYFNLFREGLPWRHDEARIYGKHYVTGRMVAWYASEAYTYTYSGVSRKAHLFTPEMNDLLALVQEHTGARYNACLFNFYKDGSQGMAYHSDDEKSMAAGASIASLTLGAERRFLFKHKSTGQVIETLLAQGSLLEMKGETQKHWKHRLPTTLKPVGPRINLTFRQMLNGA